MVESVKRNGIFYGWFIVAIGFFILFVSTGARNGFGVFIIPMTEEFGWSRGQISAAIAIGVLVNGITQPFLGGLYDRYGGRLVISLSLLVLGISIMLLSLVNNIWVLIFLYGFVASTATSGASMVTIHSIITKWFQKKRGFVLSLTTSGASAGGLVLAPFATYLIIAANWRLAWLVLGAFVLFLAFPLALFMIKETPADVGEVPDGETDAMGRPKAFGSTQVAVAPLEVDNWKESFRTPPIWQLSGAYFVCGVTTIIVSAHYVPFAIDRGITPPVAAMAFGLMMGLNVVGVNIVGLISDRFSRKNLLGTIYFIRFLAYVLLVFVPGAVGIWGFAVLAGLSWIATPPLTSSLTADIYGVKSIGALNGISNFAHQIGGAGSVLVAGLLYDRFGAYEIPFGIAGATLLIATIASFSIKERKFSIRYQQPATAAVAVAPGNAD